MPTYEYRCKACGHEFERFQSMTDQPVKTCPVCGKRQVQRLIGTGAGIIFKGNGFYCTDYRSESYRKSAKKEADGSSGTKESTGNKSGTETGGSGAPASKTAVSGKKQSDQ